MVFRNRKCTRALSDDVGPCRNQCIFSLVRLLKRTDMNPPVSVVRILSKGIETQIGTQVQPEVKLIGKELKRKAPWVVLLVGFS